MTNRQILSVVILLLCGMAFYAIPLQTEDGENAFLSGASLLPDLAVSLIFIFTALELALSFLTRRHLPTNAPKDPTVGADSKTADVAFGRSQIEGIIIVTGLLAVYAFFMLQAGYVVSSALFLVSLMFCAGGRRPVLIICIAIVVSTILFIGLRFGFGTNINAFPGFLA